MQFLLPFHHLLFSSLLLEHGLRVGLRVLLVVRITVIESLVVSIGVCKIRTFLASSFSSWALKEKGLRLDTLLTGSRGPHL